MEEPQILQMDTQGRVVLPRQARSKGKKTYFQCQTEPDGSIHLTPVVGVITSKQAYFWTKRWQEGEKEASRALRRKKYRIISPKSLNRYLNSL